MPDENDIQPTPPVAEKVKEELKPLTIEDLFKKTMQVQAKKYGIGVVSKTAKNETKYHMSKEKTKQKRKVAKASRKKNRS